MKNSLFGKNKKYTCLILKRIISFAVVFSFIFYIQATIVNAAIPKIVNFQGKLTKVSDGTNVTNGTYSFQFKIYDAISGGTLLFTESFDQPSGSCAKLQVTNGVFNAKLGSCNTALGSVNFTGGNLYLTVNFAPTGTSYDGEMSPRKQLLSSPYAFVANSVSGDGVVNSIVQSVTALAIGRAGTDYALQVDTNTASSATGLKVTSAAAGGGIGLQGISSGTNEFLTLDAKGNGEIRIGGSSTGDILLGGGSGSTGCTIANSTGNLSCAGSISGTINPGFTTGSVLFQGVSGLAQDNTNFFWDDTNNRLGVGTSGPDRAIDILDTSNPQLRLTHTDGSVYSDLQTDSSGRLIMRSSGNYFKHQGSANSNQYISFEPTASAQLTVSTNGYYPTLAFNAGDGGSNYSNIANLQGYYGAAMFYDVITNYSHWFRINSATKLRVVNDGIEIPNNSITSGSLINTTQDTSSFTGTGLKMNFASGSGSFTGNFADLQVNGSSKFKISSTGAITSDSLTSGGTQCLQANSSGVISGTGSACGSGGGSALSGITAATTTNSINNSNYTQTWAWDTLSTQTGLALSSSTLSSGTLANISVTGTAAASNSQKALAVSTAGANAASSQATYAGHFTNTHTGSSSTNIAAYFSASGGTNNYAAIFENGNVGIGVTNPTARLDIISQGNVTDIVNITTSGSDNILKLSQNNSGFSNIDLGGSNANVYIGEQSSTISLTSQTFAAQSSNGFQSIGYSAPNDLVFVQGTGEIYIGDYDGYSNTAYLLIDNSTVNNTKTVTTTKFNGLGTLTPDAKLELAGDMTLAAWGLNGIQLQASTATYTDNSTSASGTSTNAVFNSFARPTLAASNVTVTTTNAATVYIQNSPLAGTNQTITNPYSLWVDDGNVRFDGNLTVAGAVNPSFTTGSVVFQGASGLAQDNTNFFWDDTNNRLGIGTAGPDRKLDILDTANPQVRLTHTDGTIYSDLRNSTTSNLIINGSQLNSSSGIDYGVQINPTFNQTSIAGYTGLLVNVNETAVGSGAKNLIDIQKNSFSAFKVSHLFDVTGSNWIIEPSNGRTSFGSATPSSSAANIFYNAWSTAQTAFVVQGIASQSANLQEWRNSSGTALAAVSSTGALSSNTLTSGGTQCLQANSSGVISGTGSACGAGGGSSWSGLTAPSGNLSLAHAGNITTMTFNSVTTANAWTQSSASITSGNLYNFEQSSSTFTGNAINMNMANASGSFTGNFADFKVNGTSKITINSGTETTSGASAVAGIFEDLTLTNSTASGFQFGNRLLATVNGTTAGTHVGQFIRMTDSTSLSSGQIVRGLEIQAYSGTNNNGINTGIQTYGKTFGIAGETTAQAGSVSQPAAVFADLNNSSNTTVGNAIRAYTNDATATDLVSFYQETSAMTGNGLLMNFANSSGTFTGNFMDLQKNGTSKFAIDDTGRVDIKISDTDNAQALYINSEESTGTQSVFSIESDVTTNDSVKAHFEADGSLFVSLTGTQNTVALCHATNGQTTNDEIVDCSGAPSDVAEYFGSKDTSLAAGEIVVAAEDAEQLHLEGYHTSKAWVAKTNKPYDGKLLGVVSTAPAAVYGDEIFSASENPRPIALAGRVPVKVNLENGPIKAGDFITSSSVSGFGMKATKSGAVVGMALESYSGGSEPIIVFVKATNYAGAAITEQYEGLTLDYSNVELVSDNSKIILADLVAKLSSASTETLSSVSTDVVIAGAEVISPNITVSALRVDSIQTAAASGGLEVLSATIMNGGLQVDSVSSIRGLLTFTDDVEFFGTPYVNADTAGFAVIEAGATVVDVIFDREYLFEPIVSASVNFAGTSNLDGSAAEASRLASLAAANGFLQQGYNFVVANKTSQGFSLIINKPAAEQISFSWTALVSKTAKTFSSDNSGQPAFALIPQSQAGGSSDNNEEGNQSGDQISADGNVNLTPDGEVSGAQDSTQTQDAPPAPQANSGGLGLADQSGN